MSFLRYDQLPLLSEVSDDALIAVWENGVLSAAPRSAVGGSGGGGGDGHIIESNGSPLAQRDTINVTGLLQASDFGGKTLFHLPVIDLTSQVTGVLPIASGGTGLSAPGTTGQSLRYTSGGLLEAYTPSAGLSAPANPGDNGRVAIAVNGNLGYGLLSYTHLSAGAGILFTQLQAIPADRLVGSDAGGTPVQITVGGGISFTGSDSIQRDALIGDVTAVAGSNSTSIAAGAVTASKLAAAAAKGNTLVYNDGAWGEFGVKTRATDLPDANATLAVADGNRARLPALTAARQGQFSLAGATDKEIYTVERYDTTANTYVVKDSTGATLYTFPGSVRRMAVFQYQISEWVLVSHAAIN